MTPSWPGGEAVTRRCDLRPERPDGQDVLHILATFAEFEVDLLRMRTRDGMAIAWAKGKLRGRQPKLSAAQQAHPVKLHASGEHSIAELAEFFSVSRPTVYRVLEHAPSLIMA